MFLRVIYMQNDLSISLASMHLLCFPLSGFVSSPSGEHGSENSC